MKGTEPLNNEIGCVSACFVGIFHFSNFNAKTCLNFTEFHPELAMALHK